MMKKERKRRKKSVAQTWLDLNSVPLGCEESVVASTAKPHKRCYLVKIFNL